MTEQSQETQTLKGFVLLIERADRQWVVPIDKDPIRIGRSPNNHISMEESQLAPRHLKFIPLGEDVWVRDQWSPEGFYCNGALTRECKLRPGDEVRVGELKIYFLIQERSASMPTSLFQPAVELEAPEPPPMSVRQYQSVQAHSKQSKFLKWTLLVLLLGSAAFLGVLIYQRVRQESQARKEMQVKEDAEQIFQRAKDLVKEKQFAKARGLLAELPRQDPEFDARARSLEKEISTLILEEEREKLKPLGEEYFENYLKPLFTSSLLKTDIRWELITWRRCEEFLKLFPGHPRTALVQSQRNRIAGRAKTAPAPTLGEVQVEVKELLDSIHPDFSMARKSAMNLIQASLGEDGETEARKILVQIDTQAEEHLKKQLTLAKSLWDSGHRDSSLQNLGRLEKRIGREDFVKRVQDFRSELSQAH